jgi:hypothetical protein
MFHICYLIDKELCTGTNILAKSYADAENKFKKIHAAKEIVYISKLAA